jgi:adenosylcobinamide-phosphate synthase
MGLSFNFLTMFCAAVFEAVFGYPRALYKGIGHPVTWMGAVIRVVEIRLNRTTMSDGLRRFNGALLLVVLLLLVTLPAAALQYGILRVLPPFIALLVLAVLASTLIAQGSLHQHVAAVANALDSWGLDAGRKAVAKIVGRDTGSLDQAGVSRAAIESLAENFSDGVVAPVFYGGLFGLPGIAAYKAVNTADSMIGHQTPRFAAFGFAAAKLDDLLNLPASRLAALWIALAAFFHAGASVGGAFSVVGRDAGRHRSPNAGWPEAAMAGALGIQVSGPRVYAGVPNEDPWIGDGSSEATAADIRRALGIYRTACILQAVALAGLAFLIAQF